VGQCVSVWVQVAFRDNAMCGSCRSRIFLSASCGPTRSSCVSPVSPVLRPFNTKDTMAQHAAAWVSRVRRIAAWLYGGMVRLVAWYCVFYGKMDGWIVHLVSHELRLRGTEIQGTSGCISIGEPHVCCWHRYATCTSRLPFVGSGWCLGGCWRCRKERKKGSRSFVGGALCCAVLCWFCAANEAAILLPLQQ
jgi:hypothetical protein